MEPFLDDGPLATPPSVCERARIKQRVVQVEDRRLDHPKSQRIRECVGSWNVRSFAPRDHGFAWMNATLR